MAAETRNKKLLPIEIFLANRHLCQRVSLQGVNNNIWSHWPQYRRTQYTCFERETTPAFLQGVCAVFGFFLFDNFQKVSEVRVRYPYIKLNQSDLTDRIPRKWEWWIKPKIYHVLRSRAYEVNQYSVHDLDVTVIILLGKFISIIVIWHCELLSVKL